jgi:hypothetical protein
MAQTQFEHRDPEVEATLRASRPVPRPRFTHQLERRLFSRRRLWARPPRPLIAGAAAASGLAAVIAAFGLAGSGPLALHGERDVSAGSDCRNVVIQERARKPFVVRDREGRAHIHYRVLTVRRSVTRCR